MSARPTPALEAINLSKHFGPNCAVDALSFAVDRGSVTGFVGGNGAGKTTTLRMILGLTQPTSGSVLIDGRPLTHHVEPRRAIGAQIDRLGAHPGLTGRRHLSLIATASGVDIGRVDELLDQVDLTSAADDRVRTYSTGMMRRLGLAAALLVDAPLLLLDEPSNGLDPAGIRWLRTLLRARADAGSAVFVSTHQLAELGTIVDDLVIIDNGMLVAAGPVDELLRNASATSIEDLLLTGGAS